jgi:hypothetical protein
MARLKIKPVSPEVDEALQAHADFFYQENVSVDFFQSEFRDEPSVIIRILGKGVEADRRIVLPLWTAFEIAQKVKDKTKAYLDLPEI